MEAKLTSAKNRADQNLGEREPKPRESLKDTIRNEQIFKQNRDPEENGERKTEKCKNEKANLSPKIIRDRQKAENPCGVWPDFIISSLRLKC